MMNLVRRCAQGARAMNMSFGLILAIVIIPNIVMSIVAYQAGGSRDFLLLDYIAIALLIEAAVLVRLRWLLWPLAAFALFFYAAIESLIYVGNVFFFDLRKLMTFVEFIDVWPWDLVLIGLAAFAVYLGVCLYLGFKFSGKSVRDHRWISASALIICVLLPLGLATYERSYDDVGRRNFVALRATVLWRYIEPLFIPPSMQPFDKPTMASDLAGDLDGKDHILSIAFESLGVPVEGKDLYYEMLLSRFNQQLGGLYDIEVREQYFHGSTFEAEIRELCGLQLDGLGSPELIAPVADACLPGRLSALGYHTIGAHGYWAISYNRGKNYPALKFQETHFREGTEEELATRGNLQTELLKLAPYCNELANWQGPCDATLTLFILEKMQTHKRAFAHVMTKDLHYPFPRIADEHVVPCDRGGPASNVQYCKYVQLSELIFFNIAQAVLSVERKPDVIYIYGDHRPHTVIRSLRTLLSEDHVPFIKLTRKKP